jgi:hypothetical protein
MPRLRRAAGESTAWTLPRAARDAPCAAVRWLRSLSTDIGDLRSLSR